jgi:type II secretory pathway pseudopilin PulG
MTTRFGQTDKRKATSAFTIVEVMISITIFAMVASAMVYGYVQTNRRAEWSSFSLAAQSFASQWVEQAMAEKWDAHSSVAGTGYGTSKELVSGTYTRINSMLIPGTGQSVIVTNYVNITNVCDNPTVWQIRADCVWQFPPKAVWNTNNPVVFSNTVITLKGAR